MKIGNYISAMLLGLAAPAFAQTAAVDDSATRFSDPVTGVSFQYPKEWKQATGNQFYLGQDFVPENAEVRGAVIWKAWDKTEDAKTTLAGAQFLYAVQKDASSADCAHPVINDPASDSTVDTVTVGGIAYAHNHGEEGGMCHEEKEDIYATYRNGACYLFDLSVHSICSGVVDGMRDATPAELADVDARLMKILKTVKFSQPESAAIH
jgi:hypothetical protein